MFSGKNGDAHPVRRRLPPALSVGTLVLGTVLPCRLPVMDVIESVAMASAVQWYF
jgi:hypothetical protein